MVAVVRRVEDVGVVEFTQCVKFVIQLEVKKRLRVDIHRFDLRAWVGWLSPTEVRLKSDYKERQNCDHL